MKVIVLTNWGVGLELLKHLHQRPDITIDLVITQHDQTIQDPWFNSVYEYAHRCNYQTINSKVLQFDGLAERIRNNEVDLLITHAFMRILPEKIFSAPKLGSINIHPSLLPKYRGPSPAYWALKNKNKHTGLTCHFIDAGVDTGDIIFQQKLTLSPDETMETFLDKQKRIIASVIDQSLVRLNNKNFRPTAQIETNSSNAPRPEK